jgi:hypothetical protein
MSKKTTISKNTKAPKNDCQPCKARCCRYVSLEIDTPEDEQDFDNIKWYVIHKNISVYTSEGKWYLMVKSKCEYLAKDNKCSIYRQRPQICREHSTDGCEYYGDDNFYDDLIESKEDLARYRQHHKQNKKQKKKGTNYPN